MSALRKFAALIRTISLLSSWTSYRPEGPSKSFTVPYEPLRAPPRAEVPTTSIRLPRSFETGGAASSVISTAAVDGVGRGRWVPVLDCDVGAEVLG